MSPPENSQPARVQPWLAPSNSFRPSQKAALPSRIEGSLWSQLWTHLHEPVRTSLLAEIELILLTCCTGIQDAVSFPDYHCFTSNQTGNTVFLMLALVIPSLNHEMFVTANIGAALGLFLAGGWLTGQLSHIIHPRRRIWLVLCNFLQTCLVFAAAALQYAYGDVALQSTAESNNAVTLVTIGLLAFASGSQVVQSRSLGVTEISTAMATAAWIDLLIDPGLFALRNRPRTRRLTFLLTLAIGSLIGAEIYKRAGSATAIAVSGVGKLIVTFMYLFNKAEPPKEALAPPSPV